MEDKRVSTGRFFSLRRNVILFPADLMITGSEFHSIIDGDNCGLVTHIKA